MRICFIYGPYSAAAARYDFSSIMDSPDGLTGSELSCFIYAREMAGLGHSVTLFVSNLVGGPTSWDGVAILPYRDVSSRVSDFDVAYSWNDPGPLAMFPRGVSRVCNLQINNFAHCEPDVSSYVDLWTSPSASHMDVVGSACPRPCRWTVVPNGCDPSWYGGEDRIPGRVMYASSPDRGLHWLLRAWPEIRAAVPHAELHIFYRFDQWMDHFTSMEPEPWMDNTYPELISRAKYIREALRRLDGYGVHVVKSVSRRRMAVEMSRAEVLAYPCDTVSYTEGFSVTLMEACASGMIPVTTDVDALGSIYGKSVPMVPSPVGGNLREFTGLVVSALTDPGFRETWSGRSRGLVKSHTWSRLAKDLESVLLSLRREALSGVSRLPEVST